MPGTAVHPHAGAMSLPPVVAPPPAQEPPAAASSLSSLLTPAIASSAVVRSSSYAPSSDKAASFIYSLIGAGTRCIISPSAPHPVCRWEEIRQGRWCARGRGTSACCRSSRHGLVASTPVFARPSLACDSCMSCMHFLQIN